LKELRMIRDKLSLAALTFGALASLASTQSSSVYERGAIEVRPDPEFGRGTDWGSFIESEINGLAVAPDGSIFLAQQRAHTVHKFDRSGLIRFCFSVLHDLPRIRLGIVASLHEKMIVPTLDRSQEPENCREMGPPATSLLRRT
jgi:hypothetical protein